MIKKKCEESNLRVFFLFKLDTLQNGPVLHDSSTFSILEVNERMLTVGNDLRLTLIVMQVLYNESLEFSSLLSKIVNNNLVIILK